MQSLPDTGDASALAKKFGGTVHGSSRPMFAPTDEDAGTGRPKATRTDSASTTSSFTAKSLDKAIEAGDWQAVGATASRITSRRTWTTGRSMAEETSLATSFTSKTLEEAIKAGDWGAVFATEEPIADADMHKPSMRSENSIETCYDCQSQLLFAFAINTMLHVLNRKRH